MGSNKDYKDYIECRCDDRCHFIRLRYSDLDGLEIEVVPVMAGVTFWSKVRESISYILCRKDSVCCNAVLVDKRHAQKIQRWLDLAKERGYGSDFEVADRDDAVEEAES